MRAGPHPRSKASVYCLRPKNDAYTWRLQKSKHTTAHHMEYMPTAQIMRPLCKPPVFVEATQTGRLAVAIPVLRPNRAAMWPYLAYCWRGPCLGRHVKARSTCSQDNRPGLWSSSTNNCGSDPHSQPGYFGCSGGNCEVCEMQYPAWPPFPLQLGPARQPSWRGCERNIEPRMPCHDRTQVAICCVRARCTNVLNAAPGRHHYGAP